jgi:hypothetical protein
MNGCWARGRFWERSAEVGHSLMSIVHFRRMSCNRTRNVRVLPLMSAVMQISMNGAVVRADRAVDSEIIRVAEVAAAG